MTVCNHEPLVIKTALPEPYNSILARTCRCDAAIRTVADLRRALADFPDDLEVIGLIDGGKGSGWAVRVERGEIPTFADGVNDEDHCLIIVQS